jgi:hypothetical protein
MKENYAFVFGSHRWLPGGEEDGDHHGQGKAVDQAFDIVFVVDGTGMEAYAPTPESHTIAATNNRGWATKNTAGSVPEGDGGIRGRSCS